MHDDSTVFESDEFEKCLDELKTNLRQDKIKMDEKEKQLLVSIKIIGMKKKNEE